MKPKLKVILFCMGFLVVQGVLPGQDISKNNILTFADYLFKNSDYSRASYEYLRVLHLFENSKFEKQKLYLKIGDCFAKLNKLKESKKYYDYCLEAKDNPKTYSQALISYGFLLFRFDQYRNSISFLENKQLFSAAEKINTLILANYLCLGDRQKSTHQFNEYKKKGKDYLKSLDNFMNVQSKLKYKSPLLAGVMSAFIPGSGRLYTGRVKEGLLSMVSLVTTSYLAYEGFKNNGIKSFKGWLFSSISAFLYIGNIHGTVVSAKLSNQMIKNKFKSGVEVTLRIYLND